MINLLIVLLYINSVYSDPIYNDYDDDDKTYEYNFIINYYNQSNCKGEIIQNLNYNYQCETDNLELCCQNIIENYNLTNNYNLTEECSYNNDYYTTFECIEIDEKNNFSLLFTIFYILFSIAFLCSICYCFIYSQNKQKNNDVELTEKVSIIDKNFKESHYYMSHLNR